MLSSYMMDVQMRLRDQRSEAVNPDFLPIYINRARRYVAQQTQCIRHVPRISGAIKSATVTSAGTGYVNPSLIVSSPDFPSGRAPYPNGAQATGTVTANAGTISAVNITFGGDGYFQPVLTIADSAGSGATATPVMTPMNLLIGGQEEYSFRNVDLTVFPGVAKIIAVLSVSIIYANYRYSLPKYSFTEYQAKVRNYPFQYQYVPAIYTQLGQGANGSLLFYPFPSQTYQMEWDAICQPSDLIDDRNFEAIEDPWRDCVSWYASKLAFMELQNYNAARVMSMEYDECVKRASVAARPGRAINPYGRP